MKPKNSQSNKLKKRKKFLKKLTLKGNVSNAGTPKKQENNIKNITNHQIKREAQNPYLNPNYAPQYSYREIIKSQGKGGAFFDSQIPKEEPLLKSNSNLPRIRRKMLKKINLKTIPENLGKDEDLKSLEPPIPSIMRKKINEIQVSTIGSQKPTHSKKSISTNAKSTLKGTSSQLRPIRPRFEEYPTKEDIRELIETSHDVGREIENLVKPVDEESANKICQNESLKTFLGEQSLCRVYFGTEVFKEMGAGIYLFFVFLLVFSVAFVLYSLVNLGPLVLNLKGGFVAENHETHFLTKMTFGNLEKIKITSFEKTKEYLRDYFGKLQDQKIYEEQGGTLVVIKHTSGNCPIYIMERC